MSNISYFTPEEGLQRLKDEVRHLETAIERPKISGQIGEARDKGDLSENAEYDAAKEAQGIARGEDFEIAKYVGQRAVGRRLAKLTIPRSTFSSTVQDSQHQEQRWR